MLDLFCISRQIKCIKVGLCFSLFLLIILQLPSSVHASAGENFKYGFKMIVQSPKRIGEKISDETASDDFELFAITEGLLKGAVYMGADILLGITRVVTFPFDFNKERKKNSWTDYTVFDGDLIHEEDLPSDASVEQE